MSSDFPLFPAQINPAAAFAYNGQTIALDDNRLVSVTDMWRAVGSPRNREFKNWKRKEGVSFIVDLSKSLKVPVKHLYRTVSGKTGGGSWAHWQIALAYAKYLSNDFHRYVNEAFREWAEEKADPDLKAARAVEGYRRKGWDDGRITARLDGIVRRNTLTDTLKDHGVKGVGYAQCTDAINTEILGGTAREVKVTKGVPATASTRDHLDALELTAVRFAEMLAEKSVKDKDARGNGECRDVCQKAGAAVNQSIEAMGLSAKRSLPTADTR